MAILSTVDSSITYQYLDQTGVYNNPTNFVTVGIENNSGNIGLQYLHDVFPLSGTAVKFYYPDSTSLAINDASTNYTGNDGTKGIFLSKDGAPYVSVAEVKNSGNQTLASFNSYSRILNSSGAIQVRDTMPVSNLAPNQTQLVTYPDTWVPTAAGTYRHINVTLLTGDATPTNNQKDLEIVVVDTTQGLIPLSYDNSTNSTNGISWQGGGGGIGMYFIPPFYPCQIAKVGAYILDDPNILGYSMQIYDDDGPNGGPLTMLDSVFVPPGGPLDSYNETNTSQNVQITSGGFYVAWMMGGDGVLLGEDGIAPFSNRSFEILGSASNPNAWADYRNGEVSDPIIHVVLEPGLVGVAEGSLPAGSFENFYPNPCIYKTGISYSLYKRADLSLSVYNLQGQLVSMKSLGIQEAGSGIAELNVQHLEPGIYLCRITAGKEVYNRKLTIVR